MRKTSVVLLAMGTSIAALLAASSAFAAQNVANPSQKGSLLKWPYITVDPTDGDDTIIEISNDGIKSVHVECEYINEAKGRVNFDFNLTAKATASWDVGTLSGDNELPPAFPTWVGNPTDPFPGANPNRGELTCFATDTARANQVAFNELTGTGTVLKLDDADAGQPKQAYRYNAWAFVARAASGPAPDAPATPWGTAGDLILDGGSGPGHYDACPLYLIQNFMPNGAKLGNITTLDNDIHVASCNEDLRQDYVLNLTKLLFTTWDSHEHSYTGSFQCVDSVNTVGLSTEDNPYITNPGNFDFATLKTPNARLMVQGIASTQCPGSTATGLIGVFSSSVAVGGGAESDEIGSDTSGAGAAPGFVLWDPGVGAPPPAAPH